MSGYSGGYTSHSLNDVDVQPVSITSIDLGNNIASGMTRNRTVVSIDISHHVGAVHVTPAIGDQWYVEKHRGIYRLKSQIPFNNIATTVVPTQGQTQLGSGTGPIQLHGSQINSNGPLRLSSGNSPLPAPTTVDAGSLMYDPVQQKPVFSDGNSWTALGAKITPYDINYIQTTTTRAVGYGTNPMGCLIQRQVQFSSVTFRCGTADTSGNLVVELRNNGVTIAGTTTTIPYGQQVAGVTLTGSWGFGIGDILTVYVTTIGGTPGIGLSADLVGVLVSAASGAGTLGITATPTANIFGGALADGMMSIGSQATAAVTLQGKLAAPLSITAARINAMSSTYQELWPSGIPSAESLGTPTIISAPMYVGGSSIVHGGGAGPVSFSEVIPANTQLAILWTVFYSWQYGGMPSVTLGVNTMTLESSPALYTFQLTAAHLGCYVLLSPPIGTQTITVTGANSGTLGYLGTAYYTNVSSLGAAASLSTSSTSMSQSITSSDANRRYAQCFGSYDANSISGYSQTQRSPSGDASAGSGCALVYGDALGTGGTLTFTATQNSGTDGGAIVLPLISPTS